jgi:hypothetical protein
MNSPSPAISQAQGMPVRERDAMVVVCKCGKCGGRMTVPKYRPDLDPKCSVCGDFRSTSKYATAEK